MTRVAILAQLGRIKDAHAVLRDAESRTPDVVANFEGEWHKWMTQDVAEHLHQSLKKARLEAQRTSSSTPAE